MWWNAAHADYFGARNLFREKTVGGRSSRRTPKNSQSIFPPSRRDLGPCFGPQIRVEPGGTAFCHDPVHSLIQGRVTSRESYLPNLIERTWPETVLLHREPPLCQRMPHVVSGKAGAVPALSGCPLRITPSTNRQTSFASGNRHSRP